MISDFGSMIAAVWRLFCLEFTLYGFTFSWWQVCAFTIAAGILIWILKEVFLGD